MIFISELPRELTPFDLSIINNVRKNLLISDTFYNPTGMEIKATAYNAETDKYHGEYEEFTMFEGIQTLDGEFTFNDLNYIPENNEVFDGFINELLIKEIDDCTYQLINEYSGAFILYCTEEKHPFTVSVGDKTMSFDSFPIAVKFAFEAARKSHEYLPPDSRKRLEDFKVMLDSEEFEDSLQAQIEEAKAVQKKIDDFLENDFMNWVLNLPKLFADNNMVSINDSDYAYDESTVTKVMPSEIFELMIGAAFKKGNIFEEDDCIFKNENIIHGKLIFRKLYGQGVSLSISLAC